MSRAKNCQRYSPAPKRTLYSQQVAVVEAGMLSSKYMYCMPKNRVCSVWEITCCESRAPLPVWRTNVANLRRRLKVCRILCFLTCNLESVCAEQSKMHTGEVTLAGHPSHWWAHYRMSVVNLFVPRKDSTLTETEPSWAHEQNWGWGGGLSCDLCNKGNSWGKDNVEINAQRSFKDARHVSWHGFGLRASHAEIWNSCSCSGNYFLPNIINSKVLNPDFMQAVSSEYHKVENSFSNSYTTI